MKAKEQNIAWPTRFDFGDYTCTPDRENAGVVRRGFWRVVVPVRVEGASVEYVAKVLDQTLSGNTLLKSFVDQFRRIFRLDENSREWRFLARHSKNPEIAPFIPKPLAQGRVDGEKAILVERITWRGQQINADQFALQATGEQKAQMRVCIDEIIDKFGRHHVVCNDISAHNMMVSDKSGRLTMVVIDGFGNNHLIPYPVFSKRLNARKIARRLTRIKQHFDLN